MPSNYLLNLTLDSGIFDSGVELLQEPISAGMFKEKASAERRHANAGQPLIMALTCLAKLSHIEGKALMQRFLTWCDKAGVVRLDISQLNQLL